MQPIFVGDVQGCAAELGEIVARAEARFGDAFSLWVVGDLINRGPDDRGALELVRGLVDAGRAEYVLGNHELHLIAAWLGLREPGPRETIGRLLAAPDADEWIEWLRRRPLAVGGMLGGDRFVMVHASVAPDWSFADVMERAARAAAPLAGPLGELRDYLADASPAPGSARDDLGRLTRCRSVTSDGGWSSKPPESGSECRPWHEAWSERCHDYCVVYGHWALQGLHVAAGLRGLDTGCVHHGRGRDGFLTAWVPEPRSGRDGGEFAVPDDRLWQIAARQRAAFDAR